MMVFFFVHFLAHSEKTNQKRGVTPKAPFKGDAAAPPVALTLKNPQGIKALGWSR